MTDQKLENPQQPTQAQSLSKQQSAITTETKKKINWRLFLVVSFLLVITSGVAAYFIYQNYQLKKQLKQLKTEIIEHETTSSLKTINETTASPSQSPETSSLPENLCEVEKNALIETVTKFENFQIEKNAQAVFDLLLPPSGSPGDIRTYEYLLNKKLPDVDVYTAEDTTMLLNYLLKSFKIKNDNEMVKEFAKNYSKKDTCYLEVAETIDYFSSGQTIPRERYVRIFLKKQEGKWKVTAYVEVGSRTPGNYSAF